MRRTPSSGRTTRAAEPPRKTYEITRPTNGGAATSQGATVLYQQGVCNGLRSQRRTTRFQHTTSMSGPLPFASKNEINLRSLLRRTSGGSIRLTYSWRDDYEGQARSTAVARSGTATYSGWDASGTINITKNFIAIIPDCHQLHELEHATSRLPEPKRRIESSRTNTSSDAGTRRRSTGNSRPIGGPQGPSRSRVNKAGPGCFGIRATPSSGVGRKSPKDPDEAGNGVDQ